jgi:hypothetical protein
MLVFGHVKGTKNGFDRFVVQCCADDAILAVIEADKYGQYLATLTDMGSKLSDDDLADVETEIEIISAENEVSIEMEWL